jgi:hypothetical protein
MTLTWKEIRENSVCADLGCGPASELVRSFTAGERHEARKRATIEACDGNLVEMLLDLIGIGGPKRLGGQGSNKVRRPCFEKLGAGSKSASDWRSYMSALAECYSVGACMGADFGPDKYVTIEGPKYGPFTVTISHPEYMREKPSTLVVGEVEDWPWIESLAGRAILELTEPVWYRIGERERVKDTAHNCLRSLVFSSPLENWVRAYDSSKMIFIHLEEAVKEGFRAVAGHTDGREFQQPIDVMKFPWVTTVDEPNMQMRDRAYKYAENWLGRSELQTSEMCWIVNKMQKEINQYSVLITVKSERLQELEKIVPHVHTTSMLRFLLPLLGGAPLIRFTKDLWTMLDKELETLFKDGGFWPNNSPVHISGHVPSEPWVFKNALERWDGQYNPKVITDLEKPAVLPPA